MNEEWRDIKGYEGKYQVSNLGRVRSLYLINRQATMPREKILKPINTHNGYYCFDLCKNGIIKRFLVHRLVANSFIPNPKKFLEINHKDKNGLNNNIDNLEWCDRKYNVRYSKAKKVNQYDLEGNFIKTWDSIIDASRKLHIDNTGIWMCCKSKRKKSGGFIWKYENELRQYENKKKVKKYD